MGKIKNTLQKHLHTYYINIYNIYNIIILIFRKNMNEKKKGLNIEEEEEKIKEYRWKIKIKIQKPTNNEKTKNLFQIALTK